MKRILSFLIALSISFLLYSQDNKKIEDKINSVKEDESEYFTKPLDSKSGVERQIQELSQFIKENKEEKQAWLFLKSEIERINLNRIKNDIANINTTEDAQTVLNQVTYIYRNLTFLAEIRYNENEKFANIRTFKSAFVDGLYEITRNKNPLRKEFEKINQLEDIEQAVNLHKTQIIEIANKIKTTDFSSFFNQITTYIDQQLKQIESNLRSIEEKTTQNKNNLNTFYKALEEKDININEKAITWGLPIFCLTVVVLFGFAYFYRLLSKNNELSIEKEQGLTKILLEIITVLLLTGTVLILGLSDKIKGDVLGTLLGGIAGYILNRSKPI